MYFQNIPQKQIRYFLYARKSSEAEDRQVASIDSQINVLQKLAQQEGLEIVDILTEAQSAKAPGRQIFSQLLQRVSLGEAQGILCWKLDRLARNPVDGGSISWMLQSGSIQHIRTHDRSYLPTDNVLMMQVEFGMANQFIRDLSVSTKRGLMAKAERGWYPTYPALGYIHNPLKKKGEKEILTDPERFDLLREMFLHIMQGESVSKVLERYTKTFHLRNKKGKKVSKSTLYRILRDPFFYGRFEYPKNSGQWFDGKHKALISKKEFDLIQDRLDKPYKTREKKLSFTYRGVMICGECGAMVTAEKKTKRQKNGNVHEYIYYHCTKRKDPHCSQKTIQEYQVEEQLHEILRSISLPDDFIKWALNLIKKDSETHKQETIKRLITYQSKLSKVQKILDGLIEMRAGSEISEEEFRSKRSELAKEKEALSFEIDELKESSDDWFERIEKIFSFTESAQKTFKEGSDQEKRELLSLLGSNLYLKDKKLTIEVKEPFIYIQKMSSILTSEKSMFEPLKNSSSTNEKEAYYTSFPKLLRE